MKAYKVFENDWTCKGFKYEIGKTYKIEGNLEMCNNGFHACKELHNCFKFYPLVPWQKFAEVELSGKVLGENEEKCAEKITIVKEIQFGEIANLIKNQLSDGVNRSDGVNESDGVNRSDGVNLSDGVNRSYGILNCYGVDRALFLANKKRTYTIFGVEVDEERFNSVYADLQNHLNGWYPQFTNLNLLYLQSGRDWKKTPIPNAEEIQKEEAWKDMPVAAISYVKSLPEFDADMFYEITGIKLGGKKD